MYAADTIAAIATPPGAGGIGIIRISGPLAIEIAQRVFVATQPNGWESSRLRHGIVRGQSGELLDDALAVIMRAPHSYTGEDVLELHCHGSPVGLRRVLATALAHGARLAEPGEFTRRAFLNGRLDLAQAEAVAELIGARTEAGAAMAANQLLGQLSHELGQIRSILIDIRARLEVQIDFAEEDIVVDPFALANDLQSALDRVRRLRDSYRHGRLIRDGLRVSIAGKPNVGKSSLLNALLREDRAIVAALPGTTRDVIEEMVDVDGVPVLLSDTAGLRPTTDPIEALGVARARCKLETADLVIAVVDGSQPLDREDAAVLDSMAGYGLVIAINKSDLPRASDDVDILLRRSNAPVVRISALTGMGLEALRSAVVGSVDDVAQGHAERATISLVRHREALEKSAESLRTALDGVNHGLPPELIAVDVQAAAEHLGSITSAITSEDVLDRIFSKFCLGK